MEFKKHSALKSNLPELPSETLYLRSEPFKMTKTLSHISELVKKKISLMERTSGNIVEQYPAISSDNNVNLGPIMQVNKQA